MALTTYKKKRSFLNTPEPTGGKSSGNELRFVVQKHAASHLHYDFRLEMEGVLKSWAVPKGPSTDPDIKRLAMMVEDHPYDYRNFEGIIPKGEYGGGTVIVWDEGTYEPVESKAIDKKEKDKELLHQLNSGKIIFSLKGTKLQGKFALIKASGRGENAWLLMKLNDKYALKDDISLKDKSVISNKTIDEITKNPPKIYGQTSIQDATTQKDDKSSSKNTKTLNDIPHPATTQKDDKSFSKRLKTINGKSSLATSVDAGKGKKAKFPVTISPMLATLVDKPFDEEGWIYEVKWDGYRAIAFVKQDTVTLKSRNDKSFDEKFYPIHKALQELNINAVLDGEVVVVNDKGLTDFGKLQNWRSEADGELKYYLFDLLWLNGYSLMELPLTDRRSLLKELILPNETVLISENFDATGTEFFSLAEKMRLEGIIAKKANSIYSPGMRSREWLKIKTSQRQEVVIGGFSKNEGSGKSFSALLVGVYSNGKFVYTGKIGTGFSDKLQKEMLQQFQPLITQKSPFSAEPDINKPSRFRPNPPMANATWLQPVLICEVSYREMTSDGVMRHPSFQGLREDKKAKEVVQETAQNTEALVDSNTALHKKKIITKPDKMERKTFLNPTDETQVREINGQSLKFTNLSKVFWPKENITKRDMLNYYYQAAPYMLPYMENRPQSLNRHPNGINGISFYQKDIKGKVPEWIETFPYHSEADEKDKEFMVCKDEASLLYIASLGCIEMNPWSSKVQTPDNPDWCIIDLDPDKNTFNQVIETANVTKQLLDAAGIEAYCKTSGSTGMHIYIPLGAIYTYEQSKEFARVIVTLVRDQLPDFTSIERATDKRKGKLYLDFLQNRPQATIATAYSLRPKPGATVSMPLHWEEVKKGLKMTDFTIKNAIARIKNEGDIFKGVLGKGIDMKAALTKMEAFAG
jgi:bifunctional non-homologous end joining protein LigD